MTELISNLLETSLMLSLIFVSMYCLVELTNLNKDSKQSKTRKVKFIPCKDFYLEESYIIDCTCEYDNCLDEECINSYED